MVDTHDTRIKLERLVISIVLVFAISDLLPHPSLSSGIISTTLSKVEEIITKATH